MCVLVRVTESTFLWLLFQPTSTSESAPTHNQAHLLPRTVLGLLPLLLSSVLFSPLLSPSIPVSSPLLLSNPLCSSLLSSPPPFPPSFPFCPLLLSLPSSFPLFCFLPSVVCVYLSCSFESIHHYSILSITPHTPSNCKHILTYQPPTKK